MLISSLKNQSLEFFQWSFDAFWLGCYGDFLRIPLIKREILSKTVIMKKNPLGSLAKNCMGSMGFKIKMA